MSGYAYPPYNSQQGQNMPPQQYSAYPPPPQNPYEQQHHSSYAPQSQAAPGPPYPPQYNYPGLMNPMQQQSGFPSPGAGYVSAPGPLQGQQHQHQQSQSPLVAGPGAYNSYSSPPPPRSNSLETPPYGYGRQQTPIMGSPGFGAQAASGPYSPQGSRSPPLGSPGSQDAYTPVQMQPPQAQSQPPAASEEYSPVDYGAPPPKIAPKVNPYEFYGQLVDRGTGLPGEVFCRMTDALFFHLDKNHPNASVRGSGVIEPEKLYWVEMQFKTSKDPGVIRNIMNQLDKLYTDASIPFKRGANGAPVLDRKGFIHKCVFDMKAQPGVAYGRWNKLIRIFKLVDPKTKQPFPENIPWDAFPSQESDLNELVLNYESRVTREYWMGGPRKESTPNSSAQATSYTWSGGQSSAASSSGGGGNSSDGGGQDSSGNGYGGQNDGQNENGQDGNTGGGSEGQADPSTDQQAYGLVSQFIQTVEPDKKKAALYKQGAKMFTQFVGSAFGVGGSGGN